MKTRTLFVSVAALVLLVPLMSCQRSQPQPATTLTDEEVAAIGKTIDDALEAYVAKDLDRHMQSAAADLIWMEFDKRYQGFDDYREKHIKPELAQSNVTTYKTADRVVRGHSGLAYVSERQIIDMKDNAGNIFSTDSAWASYVFEKQPDGTWKLKQGHWSAPMNWSPKAPEQGAAKM